MLNKVLTRFSKVMVLPLFVMIFSCNPNQCEETVPSITFKSFSKYPESDSALLVIEFIDCDGDVGLSKSDTLPPYDVDGENYYNLYLEYFELQNGEWVKYEDLLPPFYYRIPRLSTENPKNPLEGDIQVTLEPIYYVPIGNYDTIKFEITLVDRALNRSNTVSTDPIIKGL